MLVAGLCVYLCACARVAGVSHTPWSLRCRISTKALVLCPCRSRACLPACASRLRLLPLAHPAGGCCGQGQGGGARRAAVCQEEGDHERAQGQKGAEGRGRALPGSTGGAGACLKVGGQGRWAICLHLLGAAHQSTPACRCVAHHLGLHACMMLLLLQAQRRIYYFLWQLYHLQQDESTALQQQQELADQLQELEQRNAR